MAAQRIVGTALEEKARAEADRQEAFDEVAALKAQIAEFMLEGELPVDVRCMSLKSAAP